MSDGKAMREAIRAVDEGRAANLTEAEMHEVLSEEEMRQVDWAAELETRLNAVVLSFAEQHPDADLRVTGQALLCSAAVQIMAQLEMGPDDFAELARSAARLSQDQARALRRAVMERGKW